MQRCRCMLFNTGYISISLLHCSLVSPASFDINGMSIRSFLFNLAKIQFRSYFLISNEGLGKKSHPSKRKDFVFDWFEWCLISPSSLDSFVSSMGGGGGDTLARGQRKNIDFHWWTTVRCISISTIFSQSSQRPATNQVMSCHVTGNGHLTGSSSVVV